MYRIAICEDSKEFLRKISELTKQFFRESEEDVKIEEYENGKWLKEDILEKKIFDIVILDIEMPDVSGMELASLLNKSFPEAVLIFVTAHMEYAIAGYEMSVFRYIPKSRLDEMLGNALAAACQKLNLQDTEVYIVHRPEGVFRIFQKEITYIYKEDKNAIIVAGDKKIKIRTALKNVFSELDQNRFLFIERGYIVNISQISSVEKDTVVMKNGIRLPIGASRIYETKKRVLEYWKERTHR